MLTDQLNGVNSQKLKRLAKLSSNLHLHYFWAKRWFLVSLAIGAIVLSLPTPDGLTPAGHAVLTMAIVATILFVTEPIPLPSVALLIIIAQVILMGIDSTKVAKSLMNDSVLFIMGSLMLAVCVVCLLYTSPSPRD